MDQRQRGLMPNGVDENNGFGGRDERQSSFQMAAIRRHYSDREQLEVELARRRSADIVASARQNIRESMEQSRQQIQGIRHRWEGSSGHIPNVSHQQTFQNAVFGNSSEPRVGLSRIPPEFPTHMGRSDPHHQPDGVLGRTWGNRPTVNFPLNSNSVPLSRDRRSQNEGGLLVNSSTYLRIQIDRGASSGNYRSRADMTLPPACGTSWSNAGRTGATVGHFQQHRHEAAATATEETFEGYPGVTTHCHYPGTRATGRYTRLPVLGFSSGHRTLRETTSFVSCPSERYHRNARMRSSYVGLSDGSGYFEPSALASSHENHGSAVKESYQVEVPVVSDAYAGYYSPAENYLTEMSGGFHACREYRMCNDVDLSESPVIVVSGGARGLSEENNCRCEIPASYPGQDTGPSGGTEGTFQWNLGVVVDSEEEKSGDGDGGGGGGGRDNETDIDGLLASLSDMEQFIQKIEEGTTERSERDEGLVVEGSASPVQPEDLCTLWEVIAECEGVVKAVEDAGDFDAGETLYEWSLERLDRLSTACYRFVVCLISDLVKISNRTRWKPEEFRIYMDAALLVKRTCRKMMEATADEQVSLRRPETGTTLLQILIIYIRTLRLVLELYALLNNAKPAELSEWSSSLCEALKAFVTEATRDLLDFHELLSQRLRSNAVHEVRADDSGHEVEAERGVPGEEGHSWNWRGLEMTSDAYDEQFLADHHLQSKRPTSEEDEDDSGGEAGAGTTTTDGGVLQNHPPPPPCLNQYLQSSSFSDHIQLPCLHNLVISTTGPNYTYHQHNEANQDTESGSDAEPSTMSSYPVRATAAPAGNDSDVSTDEDTTDRPMEGGSSYPSDRYGMESSSNELTAEELDIFQSMLSPTTFQLLRENVLPTQTTHEENIMLALSVQMASRVFTETSSGHFSGGMIYDGEPGQAETFDVLVNRSSTTLLDDLVQLYVNAPTKLLHSRLNVVFEGEPGVDGGALSREFFCLIFRALIDRNVKDRSVFEGDRGHLLPAVDHVLSEARVFWIVGVLVAQAASNGCHGLPGLSPAVRQFLASGARVSALEEISRLTTVEDVADLDLRNLLKKVKDRNDLNEEEKICLEMWLNRSGFSFVMSEAKTDEAIRRILRYYVFESRMSQLVSIAEGMEELGWRPIPSGFDVEIVFPSGDEISLEDLFRCLLINETPAWTSRYLQRAFLFFRKLCAELHEGKIDRLHLSDLLHFFTGAPYLKSGTNITFSQPDCGVIYPQARTCNLELIIPTGHKTYNDFKAAFSQALLLGSYGFGFA